MEFINHIIFLDSFMFNHKHPEKYTYKFNHGFPKLTKTILSEYQIDHLLKRYKKLHDLTINLSDKRYAVICDYRIKVLQDLLKELNKI